MSTSTYAARVEKWSVGPEGLGTFLDALGDGLTEVLGPKLVGAYVHGSVAMGSFVPGRSDLDLIVIVDEELDVDTKSALIRLIWRLDPPYDVRGTEVDVVLASDLRSINTMNTAELYISRHPGEPALRDRAEDDELLMNLAMLRDWSITIVGPPVEQLICSIDKKAVLKKMIEMMTAGMDELPESYAVLNAARNLVYEETDVHVSKIEGGTWAIQHGHPPRLLKRAISVQRGERRDRPMTVEGRRFVGYVIDMLQASIPD